MIDDPNGFTVQDVTGESGVPPVKLAGRGVALKFIAGKKATPKEQIDIAYADKVLLDIGKLSNGPSKEEVKISFDKIWQWANDLAPKILMERFLEHKNPNIDTASLRAQCERGDYTGAEVVYNAWKQLLRPSDYLLPSEEKELRVLKAELSTAEHAIATGEPIKGEKNHKKEPKKPPSPISPDEHERKKQKVAITRKYLETKSILSERVRSFFINGDPDWQAAMENLRKGQNATEHAQSTGVRNWADRKNPSFADIRKQLRESDGFTRPSPQR